MDRIDTGAGFSVLDGSALVMGSAIASVHILWVMRTDFSGARWLMMRFDIYLDRDHSGRLVPFSGATIRPEACQLSQDWRSALGIAGLPWLATAILQSVTPGGEPRSDPLFTMTLSIGLRSCA